MIRAAAILAAATLASAARAETDTPVTVERTVGPMQVTEEFGGEPDGPIVPFYVSTQTYIVTARTVEGRPLTVEEQDEVAALVVTCNDGGSPSLDATSEGEGGSFVVGYTCTW